MGLNNPASYDANAFVPTEKGCCATVTAEKTTSPSRAKPLDRVENMGGVADKPGVLEHTSRLRAAARKLRSGQGFPWP